MWMLTAIDSMDMFMHSLPNYSRYRLKTDQVPERDMSENAKFELSYGYHTIIVYGK